MANEPQGIGAVLRQHWTRLDELRNRRDALWLVVESVDLPGNLGTILRTAEAAGVAGVFLLGGGCDPFDAACVRASMGSIFSPKLIRCTATEFTAWARSNRVAMVASSPHGLLDYRALQCRQPVALLIGSERHGLSDDLTEAADFLVRIPMRGGCDSINAAVAAGVLLFELAGDSA